MNAAEFRERVIGQLARIEQKLEDLPCPESKARLKDLERDIEKTKGNWKVAIAILSFIMVVVNVAVRIAW